MKSKAKILFLVLFILGIQFPVGLATDFSWFQKNGAENLGNSEPEEVIFRGKRKKANDTGKYQIWGDYHFDRGCLRPHDSFFNKYEVENNGFTLGFGFPRNGKTFSFFYTYENPKHNGSDSFSTDTVNISADNHLFGGMLEMKFANIQLLGAASGGLDKYKFDTNAMPGSVFDTKGWQANCFGEAAVEIPVGQWNFRPHFGLDYHYANINDNLSTQPDTNFDAFDSNLGIRLLRGFNNKIIIFQTRFSWIHQFLEEAPIYQIRYGSQIAPTTPVHVFFDGYPGRDWCWFGVGLKYHPISCFSVFADYDLNFNKYQTIHTGSITASLSW